MSHRPNRIARPDTCFSWLLVAAMAPWQPLPAAFKPTFVKPAVEKPAIEKPSVEKPATGEDLAASPESVTLQSGGDAGLAVGGWSYLMAPRDTGDIEVATTLTIDEPARAFGYFGSSWSVWPDARVADQGFDAAVLLRAKEDGSSGYRVQLSAKYQQVTLVRFPDGGYVSSMPCEIRPKVPIRLRARAAGGVVRVLVDDKELLRYVDRLVPYPERGRIAVGVSSGARVTFANLSVKAVDIESTPAPVPHQPRLQTRTWVGGRAWVFDGDEPILLLPSPESSTVMNVKLQPGFKPLLTWNSHWDTQNQGAFAEATNHTVDVQTSGGGETLSASWRGKHVKDRFGTRSKMIVGFDRLRGVYTYDIESELEVFAGEPFHFRYGFDFEHHTPLDPFNWQYLVARRRGGDLYHRPVAPVDPGPQYDLETYQGLRVWYGRHNGDLRVAPAVEYEIRPEWSATVQADGKPGQRLFNTAVCAAFYDTGVAFPAETAKPGTKIRVKYRYTGYPADEARKLFEQSKVYVAPTLDPNHHYLFADEWPKLTFSQFVPMSETWQLGRSPFMTGHNQRPTYELVKNCGAGSGFAMKLGPASYGKATLSKAVATPTGTVAKGRYLVTALVKGDNVIGPGGRLELEALQAKTGKKLAEARHFCGAGSFDWRPSRFVFELPEDAGTLNLALGNSGTGDFLVTDIEFRRLADSEPAPAGALAKANDQPAALPPAVPGAVADYRMLEGKGFHSLNYAGGEHLHLANLDWVVDQGRPALRVAENESGRQAFHPAGYIGMHIFGNAQDFNYLSAYRSYDHARGKPFAMGAGGGIVLGCERYYLHGAFYRGLIGRTVILQRTLNAEQIMLLSQDQPLPTASENAAAAGAAANGAAGAETKGVTLAAWIKPAARLGNDNMHPGGGDIIGYGNRRYVLKLLSVAGATDSAPYRLAARLNVNDGLASEQTLEADRWYHVGLSTSLENGQRRMRLFIDGKQVAEGLTTKWSE